LIDHLADWYPGLNADTAEALDCQNLAVKPLAVPVFARRANPNVRAAANPAILMEFDSESDLESYATSTSYGRKDRPQIYAALVIGSEGPDWDYTIRGNASFLPALQPPVSPYQRDVTPAAIDQYIYADWFSPASAMPAADSALLVAPASFTGIQLAMDRYILGAAAPANDSQSTVAGLGLLAATLLEYNCSGALENPSLTAKVGDMLRAGTLAPQRV